MPKQWKAPDCGTLRIKNPKTLERWVQSGLYQKELNDGYIFATGCGRFRKEVCTCCVCRRPNAGKELQEVINKHHKIKIL